MTPRRQDGTVAVETAVLAPALLMLMLLVVYAGRASHADADVTAAAARAARAASQAPDPTAAATTADIVARTNLATAGITCADITVTLADTALAAGGTVTVQVGCRVANSDIALVAIPGSRWSVATATQVVDTYRGGT